MDALLDEIVQDILSRLPIRSLMRSRCVCRSWRDLARGPLFNRHHLARSSAHNPGLILHTSICFNATFFHSLLCFVDRSDVHNPTCSEVLLSLPDLPEFSMIGSCNGLLCLVNRTNKFIRYVCNPFTREYIRLPNHLNPRGRPLLVISGFGFSPKTQEYKVVEISNWTVGNDSNAKICSEIFVYTLGDLSWKRLGNCPPYFPLTADAFASTSLVNGALHWVSWLSASSIVVFDIADEVFEQMPGPEVSEGRYFIGALGGCLVITNAQRNGNIDVWIMREYGVKDSWAKCFVLNLTEVDWNARYVRVLCYQEEDSEVLLMYNHQLLVSYDLQVMKLRKVIIAGLPSWFEAVLHTESLISPLDFFRSDAAVMVPVKCTTDRI